MSKQFQEDLLTMEAGEEEILDGDQQDHEEELLGSQDDQEEDPTSPSSSQDILNPFHLHNRKPDKGRSGPDSPESISSEKTVIIESEETLKKHNRIKESREEKDHQI